MGRSLKYTKLRSGHTSRRLFFCMVIIIVSILFGFFATSAPELGGTIGYELNLFLQDYIY
mgnify:CR=1 FL=1